MHNRNSVLNKVNGITALIIIVILLVQMSFLFSINRNIENQSQEDIETVTSRINFFINDKLQNIQKTQNKLSSSLLFNHYLSAGDTQQKDTSMFEIKNFMSLIQDYSADMLYLMLFDSKGNSISMSNNLISQEIDQMENLYTEYTLLDPELKSEYSSFFLLYNQSYNEIYICSFMPITEFDYKNITKNNIGVSLVCSKVNMSRFAIELSQFKDVNLSLTDGERRIDILKNIYENYTEDRFILKEVSIPNSKWRIYGTISTSKMGVMLRKHRNLIIYELIIIAILFAILQLILNRSITSPIKKVIKYLKNYHLTDKKQKLVLKNKGEIGFILEHINDMLTTTENVAREIVATQRRLYEAELSNKEATLHALQNQINPHFLYNVLNCIGSIAVVNDLPEIHNMSSAVSDIMRYTITGNEIVKLEEEIKMVLQYIQIMEIRYSDSFDVEIKIDDELMTQTLPKMTLQPIVENVFKHGFFANERTGLLTIEGSFTEMMLEIMITDNGCGMDEERLTQIQKQLSDDSLFIENEGHIGLVNLDRRIKFHYGNTYGLRIYSEKERFTTVVVCLPKL